MKTLNLLRCLVVDDEPQARSILKRYIEQVPSLTLAGECTSALEALAFLQQQPVDLLFLDIQMPQLKGTDLVKILAHPPKIIFTTAYADYALEGFELGVDDYLLKPIQFDRFLKAVQRTTQALPIRPESTIPATPTKNDSFVYFRSDRKMIKVLLHDICYIESMKDYVKVITTSGTIITKMSMNGIEAMLSNQQFLRVHRSYMVAIAKIKSYSSESIDIAGQEIPIGRLYRATVIESLGS